MSNPATPEHIARLRERTAAAYRAAEYARTAMEYSNTRATRARSARCEEELATATLLLINARSQSGDRTPSPGWRFAPLLALAAATAAFAATLSAILSIF